MIGGVDGIKQALTMASGPVTDERAHALRERYLAIFADAEFPVPVAGIAEDPLGLSVAEVELDVSGMLIPSTRLIYVNATEPDPRRRFTIAHELGHWVCQCLEGRRAPVFCRSTDVGVGEGRLLEREANIFAAELLMPDVAVRLEFARDPGPTPLAAHFGVSKEAMHWRLFNLGPCARPPTMSTVEQINQVPRVGMFATVRNRRGVVSGVEPFDGPSGRPNLAHLGTRMTKCRSRSSSCGA
jgi:hypothetical protein